MSGRVVGVVLAGGAGSRLGRSKAGLRLPGGQAGKPGPTLVDWAADRLDAVAGIDEVLIAGGAAGRGDGLDHGLEGPPPDVGRSLPRSLVADGPGSGPAAGILGAADERPGRRLLVLACDLPLVPVDLLRALAASDAELAPATSDPDNPRAMNPTCAVWTPAVLRMLRARVEGGDFRLYPLTRSERVRVDPVDAGAFGDPDDVLLNVNTSADWDRACALLGSGARPAG